MACLSSATVVSGLIGAATPRAATAMMDSASSGPFGIAIHTVGRWNSPSLHGSNNSPLSISACSSLCSMGERRSTAAHGLMAGLALLGSRSHKERNDNAASINSPRQVLFAEMCDVQRIIGLDCLVSCMMSVALRALSLINIRLSDSEISTSDFSSLDNNSPESSDSGRTPATY